MEDIIKHNENEFRFELEKEELIAYVQYKIHGKDMLFTHTIVPKELEGKGIGSTLVKHALDYALVNNYKIVPICPFVKVYVERHPEYQTQ